MNVTFERFFWKINEIKLVNIVHRYKKPTPSVVEYIRKLEKSGWSRKQYSNKHLIKNWEVYLLYISGGSDWDVLNISFSIRNWKYFH